MYIYSYYEYGIQAFGQLFAEVMFMTNSDKDKTNILTFRLTPIRKKKLQKLKDLELFSNTPKMSQILDYLIDTVIEHPDRFEQKPFTSEFDVLEHIAKIRDEQLKFYNNFVDVLQDMWEKITEINNNVNQLLTRERVADLRFSDRLPPIKSPFGKDKRGRGKISGDNKKNVEVEENDPV